MFHALFISSSKRERERERGKRMLDWRGVGRGKRDWERESKSSGMEQGETMSPEVTWEDAKWWGVLYSAQS